MTPTTGTRAWMAMAIWGASTSGCVSKETIDNPLHCANNSGDSYCADLYPDGSRPYCSSGEGDCARRYISGTQRYCHGNGACGDVYDGCVANQPEGECYAPWGKDSAPPPDSSSGETSTETDGMTSQGSSDSGGTSGTGPGMCEGHGDCIESGTPLCVGGMCVPCEQGGAGDCAVKDPARPVCDAGECVECTANDAGACSGATPVCDAEQRECVGCDEHAQCPDSACNLVDGSCLPTDAVIHVDGDGGQDFMSIGAAVGSVGAGGAAVIVVHERDMAAPYAEAVVIDGGKTIAVLAASGEVPVVQGTAGEPGIAVVGAGTAVFVEEMGIAGSTSGVGLSCDGTTVDVRRSRVVQNAGGGILVTGGCQLHIENAFVGGDVNNTDAIVVQGSTLDLLYTTVVAGDGNLGENSRALVCAGRSSVTVRNSILVAIDDGVPEVDCAEAFVARTASENPLDGDGNEALGEIQSGWFVDLNGDFHLSSAPAAIDTTARWESGDPLIDIDGDLRPGAAGAVDHAGADVQ